LQRQSVRGESVKSISSELLRPTSPTHSDGLAVQLVEQTPFARVLDSTISRVVQVSEYNTTVAIAHALRLQSLLLEGSAATIMAAVMTPELGKYRRGRILLVLTRGNISSNTVAKALVADVPDPGIRQELGLRHIINSVERHGAIPMK
jgi:threonine dehydratase